MPRPWSQRCRAIRARAGLTQCQLATLCDCHPQTVSGWERGRGGPFGLRAAVLELIETHPQPAGLGLASLSHGDALRRLMSA